MRFEPIKKDSKVTKLIDQFLSTKYTQVEVINEDDYKNNTAMTAAIRATIKNDYEGKIQVTRKGERVTLYKIKNN